MAVVDKHHAMADEHAVADYDAGADETVAGDFAAAADLNRLLDLDEGANAGLVTDFASIEVHERRQPHARAKSDVIGDRNVARKLPSGRHHATLSVGRIGTIAPCCRSDRLAASSTLTVRRAESPSVRGVLPVSTQSTKCRHSTSSGRDSWSRAGATSFCGSNLRNLP